MYSIYKKIQPIIDFIDKTVDNISEKVEDVKAFVIGNAIDGCNNLNDVRGEINLFDKNINPLSVLPECKLPCKCVKNEEGKQRCDCDFF